MRAYSFIDLFTTIIMRYVALSESTRIFHICKIQCLFLTIYLGGVAGNLIASTSRLISGGNDDSLTLP